jgi:hypothetical protein
MLTTLIIMTLLVGFFIGISSTVALAVHLINKEARLDAMKRHPSNRVGPNPFTVHSN